MSIRTDYRGLALAYVRFNLHAYQAAHADLGTRERLMQRRTDALTAFAILETYGFQMEQGEPVAAGKRGRMKECYANAWRMCMRSWDASYLYCEGYAVSEAVGIPLQHAWALDSATGKVVDPTWIDGIDYFGVAWRHAFAASVLSATGVFGVLPELWRLDDLLPGWRADLASACVPALCALA